MRCNYNSECFVDNFRTMEVADPTCTTPETWSLNVSMKRENFKNCLSLDDNNRVREKTSSLIFSDNFKRQCQGLLGTIAISQSSIARPDLSNHISQSLVLNPTTT